MNARKGSPSDLDGGEIPPEESPPDPDPGDIQPAEKRPWLEVAKSGLRSGLQDALRYGSLGLSSGRRLGRLGLSHGLPSIRRLGRLGLDYGRIGLRYGLRWGGPTLLWSAALALSFFLLVRGSMYAYQSMGWGTWSSIALGTTTVVTATSDANKLTYFTPRFSGFQFGVSYTPNVDVRGGDRQTFGLSTDNDEDGQANYISLGANFVESFNGVDIAISGGYELGDLEADADNSADDDEAWMLGLNIGFSGFTVGGSYGADNNSTNNNDSESWDIGVSYSTGPWGVSLGYMHSEAEVTGGDDERDLGEAAVSYALGPGITIVGSVQYFDEDMTSTTDSDGWAAAIMSKLSF